MFKIDLKFMERGILCNLLEKALEDPKNSIIFKGHRYSEDNIEYVKRLLEKIKNAKENDVKK